MYEGYTYILAIFLEIHPFGFFLNTLYTLVLDTYKFILISSLDTSEKEKLLRLVIAHYVPLTFRAENKHSQLVIMRHSYN